MHDLGKQFFWWEEVVNQRLTPYDRAGFDLTLLYDYWTDGNNVRFWLEPLTDVSGGKPETGEFICEEVVCRSSGRYACTLSHDDLPSRVDVKLSCPALAIDQVVWGGQKASPRL